MALKYKTLLLCLAPDGTLETWQQIYANEWFLQNEQAFESGFFLKVIGPPDKLWSREIIDEWEVT